MNENQVMGTARNLGGKVEEEFGSLVGSRQVQGEGIIDQVRGTAEDLYGDAREVARTAYDRAAPVIRDTADKAIRVTRENSVLAVLAAGAIGYALSWAFHSDRGNKANRR